MVRVKPVAWAAPFTLRAKCSHQQAGVASATRSAGTLECPGKGSVCRLRRYVSAQPQQGTQQVYLAARGFS